MSNRQNRRHPTHPCLPQLQPSKESVINNERKKADSNPKSKTSRNGRRDV